MSELEPVTSLSKNPEELLAVIESSGGSTSHEFNEWLDRKIAKLISLKADDPKTEEELKRLNEAKADPTKKWQYCMEESELNYKQALRYRAQKRDSMNDICTRASLGWSATAGRLLREQYNIKDPGELLY